MSIEITLITTGGTIDGADSDKGSLRHSSDAAKWLEKQPGVRVVHVPVVNKDSRLLSGDDREKIVEAVYNSPSDRVLVTHGTFTMRDGQGY
jgi:L-asparaginase